MGPAVIYRRHLLCKMSLCAQFEHQHCLNCLHLLIKLLLGDLPTLELLQQPALLGKVCLILMQLACPSFSCWQPLLHLLDGDLFGCPHLLCQLLLSLQLLCILLLTGVILVLHNMTRAS